MRKWGLVIAEDRPRVEVPRWGPRPREPGGCQRGQDSAPWAGSEGPGQFWFCCCLAVTLGKSHGISCLSCLICTVEMIVPALGAGLLEEIKEVKEEKKIKKG